MNFCSLGIKQQQESSIVSLSRSWGHLKAVLAMRKGQLTLTLLGALSGHSFDRRERDFIARNPKNPNDFCLLRPLWITDAGPCPSWFSWTGRHRDQPCGLVTQGLNCFHAGNCFRPKIKLLLITTYSYLCISPRDEVIIANFPFCWTL